MAPIFLVYIIVAVMGLSIGSFLNVVIFRLEKDANFRGRSYCPHCNHILSWQDLFPVFSFLILKGRCRYCMGKISWQYPVVEISTALIFLIILNSQLHLRGGLASPAIFNQFLIAQLLNILFLFYIASSLIVIFVYDLKHYIIPDKILFPTIIVALIYRLFQNLIILELNSNFKFQISNFSLVGNYLFAALIASGFFLLIFLISKGSWIGFGDVKLAFFLGLILGFPNILAGLFLAFMFGAIIGLVLMVYKIKGLKSEVPFAPFLILGTVLSMFWGNEIVSWYLGYFIL